MKMLDSSVEAEVSCWKSGIHIRFSAYSHDNSPSGTSATGMSAALYSLEGET